MYEECTHRGDFVLLETPEVVSSVSSVRLAQFVGDLPQRHALLYCTSSNAKQQIKIILLFWPDDCTVLY